MGNGYPLGWWSGCGYNLIPTWAEVDMELVPTMVGGQVAGMENLGGGGCGLGVSTSALPI